MVIAWLLLSCAPVALEPNDARPTSQPDGGGGGDGGGDAGDGGDPQSDDEPEHVAGNGSGDTDDASVLFDLDKVHELTLTLSEEALDSLTNEPFTFVHGSVTIDDSTYDDVGVRLSGKLGSYRSLSDKAGFVIDLNQYVEDQRHLGLERIVPKNLVQDASYTHERIAFAIYEAMGIPAPRVGYLWVTVNSIAYGLYANIEALDDRFLRRAFDEPDGNLYDGDYVLRPDWSDYTLLDFDRSTQDWMALDEGTDVGHEDVHAVTAAIHDAAGGGEWTDTVGAVVDLEHHTRYMAVELWVGQYDGYSNYSNNYRPYFDPADGRMRMIPWDHDWAFYDSSPMTPQYGDLSIACYADAACRDLFYDAMAELCATLPDLALLDEVDAAADLLTPYIEKDPRKETTAAYARYYQEHLRSWIRNRNLTIRSSYGIDCE